MKVLIIAFAMAMSIACVSGHAWMKKPKSRQGLFENSENPRFKLRVPGQYTTDVQAMQCGFQQNHPDNPEKKCSICGEKWDGLQRLTKGGDLYKGTIQETYVQGSRINITLKVNINSSK